MSNFEECNPRIIIQQSKDHRDAMNQLLQTIELDINDPESLVTFVGNVKVSQNPTITFYDHKIKDSNGT